MIRQDKVHAITCTGANLEEDLFNLVARSQYVRLPNYRELSPQQEEELLRSSSKSSHRHVHPGRGSHSPHRTSGNRRMGLRCAEKERGFPHEFLFKILRECRLKKFYEIDPADSWMIAAAHKDLPMFVPGWEDSTLGNIYAARCITGSNH